MPKVTQLPILNTATTQTYFLVVDNFSSKRFSYANFGTSLVGYTGSAGQSQASISNRTVKSFTTPVIANGEATNISLDAFKAYSLFKVTANASSVVRIYTDSASRSADAQRLVGNTQYGSGLVTEVITTSSSLTKLISPAVIGFNNDTQTTTTAYISVINNSGVTRSITIALELLKLEG